MLNGAVPGQAGSTLPQGVDAGTSETDLTVWRERALLCQERDLGRALAYFTFIADVTTLASDCRFAGDGQTLAARYNGLSFPACAFHSQDRSNQHETLATHVATLTRRLVAPHETFFCLVPGGQLPIVRDAYHLSQVHPEWQMFFRGDESRLDPGDAVPLKSSDLPEMRALAHRAGMMAFERDPLGRGPWYGVRRHGRLVAQGGTHLLLSRAAELGNVVTARVHRRRGYASRVVAALLRDLHRQGKSIFLQVLKDNEPAIALYEKLGFERLRTMYLVRCRL